MEACSCSELKQIFCHSHVNNDVITLKKVNMRDNFHEVVDNTWYSILFDHKVTKLFCIEIFLVQSILGWEGSYYNYNIVLIIIVIIIIIIIYYYYYYYYYFPCRTKEMLDHFKSLL